MLLLAIDNEVIHSKVSNLCRFDEDVLKYMYVVSIKCQSTA